MERWLGGNLWKKVEFPNGGEKLHRGKKKAQGECFFFFCFTTGEDKGDRYPTRGRKERDDGGYKQLQREGGGRKQREKTRER